MLSRKENKDSNAKIKSIIGQDAIVDGTLQAKGATRIDGVIRGDVKIDEVLVLGVTSKVVGNIYASVIMVGGQVEGDLIAKEKVTISATGKVLGNLHTKKLIVDENAVFHGQCFMGDEIPEPAPGTFKAVSDNGDKNTKQDKNVSSKPDEK